MFLFIRLLVICAAFYCSILTVKSQTWQTTSIVDGNLSYRHDDAYFLSTSLGYSILFRTDNSIGTICKTVDGGNNWLPIKTSLGTHFRCITFMDDQVGIVGNLGKGSYDDKSVDTIPIYRTTDGGLNWIGTNPGLGSLKGMCALFKVNQTTIYGAGRVRGPAHLIKSTDKGASWQVITLTSFGLGAAMDLYFSHPDTGFVVGMNEGPFSTVSGANYKGKVIYTTNGGQTWTTVIDESINPTYFWKISFPSKKVGYVSLQQNLTTYNTVIYYKTTNSGNNWTKYTIPTSLFGNNVNFYTQGIGFIDEKTGWIGGGGDFSTNFIETNDGGTTWSNITTNDSYRINKIRFLGDTFAYAAGLRISKYKRSSKLVTNDILENKETDPVSLFPNPVSDKLSIFLNENIWKSAHLTIHTISGEVKLEKEIIGNQEIDFQNFSSGVYFVKLESEGKIWFTRIVKE